MNKGQTSGFIVFIVIVAFFLSGFVYFITQEMTQINNTALYDGTLSTEMNYSTNTTIDIWNVGDFISNLNTLSSDNTAIQWGLILLSILIVLAVMFMVGLGSPF